MNIPETFDQWLNELKIKNPLLNTCDQFIIDTLKQAYEEIINYPTYNNRNN